MTIKAYLIRVPSYKVHCKRQHSPYKISITKLSTCHDFYRVGPAPYILSEESKHENWKLALQEVLDFVVEDKHEGAASASEDVGEGAFEEGAGAFGLQDDGPAVGRALVEALVGGPPGLHHHAPSDRVERIRGDARYCCHCLQIHQRTYFFALEKLIQYQWQVMLGPSVQFTTHCKPNFHRTS